MPNVNHDWLYRHDGEGARMGLTYAHMANIERIPRPGMKVHHVGGI